MVSPLTVRVTPTSGRIHRRDLAAQSTQPPFPRLPGKDWRGGIVAQLVAADLGDDPAVCPGSFGAPSGAEMAIRQVTQVHARGERVQGLQRFLTGKNVADQRRFITRVEEGARRAECFLDGRAGGGVDQAIAIVRDQDMTGPVRVGFIVWRVSCGAAGYE